MSTEYPASTEMPRFPSTPVWFGRFVAGLLATTALTGAFAPAPARAQSDMGSGGAGASPTTIGAGGAGGLGSATTTGGIGETPASSSAGGGGGGAGVTGGIGGMGSSYGGGAAVSGGGGGGSPGAPGADGGSASTYSGDGGGGGGGGGGAHGSVVATSTTNTIVVVGGGGGSGGVGGNGQSTTGGGGGGQGGYGTAVNGAVSYTNSGTVTGGNGGAGGDGNTAFGSLGGNGGDGGHGLAAVVAGAAVNNGGTITGGTGGNGGNSPFSASSAGSGGNAGAGIVGSGVTINNAASVTGGAGGVIGTGSTPAGSPTPGHGGAGIVGSDLTIINTGSIVGGMNGSGSAQANAITFTGGANTLVLAGAWSLSGNIGIESGSVTFNPLGALSVANAITGKGSVIVPGANTMTLAGNNTYEGGTTVNNGTLSISSAGNLGNPAGGVTLNGGTLQTTASLSSSSAFYLTGGGGTFTPETGTTLTLSGTINDLGASTGTLTMAGTGTLVLAGASTYTGGTNINEGTVSISSDANLGASSGSLTVDGGTLQTTADLKSDRSITLGPRAGAFMPDAGTALTLNGEIGGPGGLFMIGPGTLTLTGANSYADGTIINAGTLVVSSGGNLGSPNSGSLTLNGSTLRTTASMAYGLPVVLNQGGGTFTPDAGTTLTLNADVDGPGTLTMAGAGTLVLAGGAFVSNFSGGTTVNSGTLSTSSDQYLGSGGLTLNGGTLQTTASFGIGLPFTLGDKGGTFAPTAGTTLTVSSAITGAGSLTMVGPGTLALAGENNYTGGTVFKAGTLSISDDRNLGHARAGLTMNGGTLASTADVSTNRSIVLGSDGGSFSPAAGTTLTLTSAIEGAGGLTATGAGTLELKGETVYTGATTISSGTLALADYGKIAQSSGVNLTGAGAVFDIAAANGERTIQGLSGISGTSVNFGTRTLSIDSTNSTTFAGAIEGSGALVKKGVGTQILAGANTYSGGTKVEAGTLSISSDDNLGNASGGLTIDGGMLQATANMSSGRSIALGSNGGTLGATSGATLTLTGTIDGAVGLTVAGAGTVALAGTYSYAGASTVTSGTLALIGAGNIGQSSGVNLAGTGAVLDISGSSGNQTIQDLTGVSGTTVNLGANRLVVGSSGASTFSGTVAGFGGLTMAGSGTLTLAGTNLFEGGMTVTGGTLAVSSNGSLGGIVHRVTLDGGTLQTTASFLSDRQVVLGSGGGTFNPNAGMTLGWYGAISGLGGLTMAGPGSLTLAGANTYSGGTTVNGGILSISADSNLGDVAGGLTLNGGALQSMATLTSNRSIMLGVNGGTIKADAGTTLTLSGTIGGTVGFGLGIEGAGTVALGGANTYAGWTGIGNDGRLALVGNGSISQSAGVLFLTPGTFDISGSSGNQTIQSLLGVSGTTVNLGANSLTLGTASLSNFAGSIQGSGGLIKQGAGTLMLTGQNTYGGGTTINAGTVSIASDGNLGNTSGGVTMNGGALQTTASLASGRSITLGNGGGSFNPDTGTKLTLSGPIGGSGGLTMAGPGTLALTGANTYSGGTSASAGTLLLENGSLASGVAVGTGGTFGGSGTVTGNVTNAGTLALNTSGPLNVIGTYTNNAGSTYQVQVVPAKSSQLRVTGSAVLNGGTVAVMAGNGNYTRGPAYNILNASAGVTGTFASVTSNLAFLTPSLSYDANNVYLTLLQSSNAFSKGARTANHGAVAAALDKANTNVSGDFAAVLDAIVQLDTQQGPAALNVISGQSYANLGTFNTQTASAFMSAVSSQLSSLHGGQGRGGTYVALAALSGEACTFACEVPPEPSRFGAWLSGVGGLGSVLGDANAATMTYNFGGTAVGIDYRVRPDLLVGVAAGYVGGTQWVNGFSGQASTDAFSGSLYASYTPGNLYVDGLAGYAYASNRMTRMIAIPGLTARTAQGTTGANQVMGLLESGWRFDLPLALAASVTPFARLQGSTTTQSGFTESGANSLNLVVQQQTVNSLRSTFGVDLSATLPKATIGVRLGWQHEYADTSRPMTASFSGSPGTPFTVFGATPQRDSAVVGLGATFQVADATEVSLRYDGELGGGTNNNALTLGLRMKW
ncbi:autotransporter-associated beta strand repeat-containing protein [Reyranella sp.]|uniref:autotransporter-associated beta strand repeat-containing protein n=1 Tax=Reyranella sp. TaxID=1929291 RepID=UPI0026243809|nr:autotransporter-associated beta strand repeat-containing protein [Reyranella sp.]